jgi:hypothetical protein
LTPEVTVTTDNPWSDEPNAQVSEPVVPTQAKSEPVKPQPSVEVEHLYDVEGLQTDFPTATELERFVYDQTQVVLNLKGRSNKLKYETALKVLNGEDVDTALLGRENPYISRSEMVPEEPMQPRPKAEPGVPPYSELQNEYVCDRVPHTIAELRGQGKKCTTVFRKYKNGVITYEVIGPLAKQPEGTKIDKYGRERPEIIRMVDPRTPESIIVAANGTVTNTGKRVKAMMQTLRYNNSNEWDIFVDQDFTNFDSSVKRNPWLEADL